MVKPGGLGEAAHPRKDKNHKDVVFFADTSGAPIEPGPSGPWGRLKGPRGPLKGGPDESGPILGCHLGLSLPGERKRQVVAGHVLFGSAGHFLQA